MIIPDLKAKITTIMARRKPETGEITAGPAPMKPEISKTEDGELDGRHAAAEDVLAAHHEKSPQKLMEALSNFMELHLHEMKKREESKEGDEY